MVPLGLGWVGFVVVSLPWLWWWVGELVVLEKEERRERMGGAKDVL